MKSRPANQPCPAIRQNASSQSSKRSDRGRVPDTYHSSRRRTLSVLARAENSARMSSTAFGAIFAGALSLIIIASAIADSAAAQSAADPEAGRVVFQQCRACHSLSPSENGRGPTLYHLFGRMAGTVPGYFYSAAMKNSHIVWTAATLERYLADPREFVPGGTMAFAGINDRKDMKNLLAYLRQATR